MAKILFLMDNLPFGGAERQLSLLLKYLPSDWETRVVALRGGPYYQVLQDQKTSVVVYSRHFRFDIIPVFQLYAEIIRYKPDIIHAWGGLSSALVVPICKALRILLIGSIRTGRALRRYNLRTRITFKFCDHIVANSIAGVSAYKLPDKKSSVIYNAIDPDRLALIKQKPDPQDSITTVVMTGRISSDKDFSTFFTAARRLDALEPGCWKFVAIGAGDRSEQIDFMQQAKDLVDNGIVSFPQAGLEVLPYLREANIGVLLSPSHMREGFSNSIMEYMICELPVICTDGGGNGELVIDGETGFVIPSGNVDSLIDKLLFLKKNPDIAQEMGTAGYKRVTSLCSIDRMICEYEDLYTELLSKRNKQAQKSNSSQLKEIN